jgi:hypothetical protein
LNKQGGRRDLVVEKAEKQVELSRMISDLQITGSNDCVVLNPGEILRGMVTYPQTVWELPPGQYLVRHQYRLMPFPRNAPQPTVRYEKARMTITNKANKAPEATR